jgi:hypothetical protein
MKIASLVAAATFSIGAAGCLISERPDVLVQDSAPYFSTIDAGETLSTELGRGAGVFVEYQRGGTWRIWTSCDTKLTGMICRYQVNVGPRAKIEEINAFDLESSDYFERYTDGTFTLFADTDIGTDVVEFKTKPGALVDVELIIDGHVDPRYLVWYGNDRIHDGAPRSPVVLQPDAP